MQMELWIAKAVGLMHIHKISQHKLAAHIGVTNNYISMILNGKKNPKGAKERLLSAICELVNTQNG